MFGLRMRIANKKARFKQESSKGNFTLSLYYISNIKTKLNLNLKNRVFFFYLAGFVSKYNQ